MKYRIIKVSGRFADEYLVEKLSKNILFQQKWRPCRRQADLDDCHGSPTVWENASFSTLEKARLYVYTQQSFVVEEIEI